MGIRKCKGRDAINPYIQREKTVQPLHLVARTRTSDKFQHIRISIGEGSNAQQILRPITHSYIFAKEFQHNLLLDPTTFIDSHQHRRGIKDQGNLRRAVSIQLQFIWQEYLPTIQKSSPSAQFTLYFVLLHLDRIFGYFYRYIHQ